MFSYITSATGLLKCRGQAEPSMRELTVVLVIIAAPCAMVSPISRNCLMCG